MSSGIFIRTLAAAVVLASASPVFSQEVTRSAQIPGLRPYDVDLKVISGAEKDSVRMVAELWKNYVLSFTSSGVSESQRRSMWVDGSADYLQEFDDGNLLYSSFRENRILDIRKVNGGTYEIICMTVSKLPGEDYEDWVESVYRVCAMAVASKPSVKGARENPFRLCNYLDAVIPTLSKTSIGRDDFFCAGACEVPKRQASRISAFIQKFVNDYSIEAPARVKYVVAPSVDECERLSGFLFNVYSNPFMASVSVKNSNESFFGKTFGSDVLVSNYYDDIHDVARLLVRSGYPKALEMIQEGVASFYGGYMDCSYSDLKASLRVYLDKNKVDFSDENNFYDLQAPLVRSGRFTSVFVPLENLLGSVLVERAVNANGSWKVRDLLACKGYSQLYPALGVSAKDINSFVKILLGN